MFLRLAMAVNDNGLRDTARHSGRALQPSLVGEFVRSLTAADVY